MELKLNKDEQLTKVSIFNLMSDKTGIIKIEVHNVVAGINKGKFIAVPQSFLSVPDNKFIFKADSENDALTGLLNLISGLSLSEIYPDHNLGM